MSTVNLPFGDSTIEIELDESQFELKNIAKPTSEREPLENIEENVIEALENPIGGDTLLSKITRSTKIAIVVDDISRPTPTKLLLEPLIKYLKSETDVEPDNITFIFGLGVHREMTHEEAEIKLGEEIANNYNWENHDPYENLADLGTSSRGTPILVNKTYVDADYKISVGLVEPHLWAGFSGGRKGIIPGIAGVDTIYENHKLVKHSTVKVGNLDNNHFREDIEETVKQVDIDLLLNCILTPEKEISEIVAGHPQQAFEEAVKTSRELSELPVEGKSDIIISSPHPLGIDFRQSSKAAFNTMKALKKGGVMIVVSECPEGRGNVKTTDNPPKRWLIKLLAKFLPAKILMWIIKKQGYGVEDAAGTFQMFKFIAKYDYIFVSPNISKEDEEILFVADHTDTAEEALELAQQKLGKEKPTVNVFPLGGATFPKIIE